VWMENFILLLCMSWKIFYLSQWYCK
jgi:hypothetical protein